MGLGGINIWQLLIILAIVVLVFGTKRLKNLGGDVGGAIKSFRKAMDTDDSKDAEEDSSEARQLGADEQKDAEFSEQADKKKSNSA